MFRQLGTLGRRRKILPQPRSIIVQNVDRVFYKVSENKLYLKQTGKDLLFTGLGNLPQFENINGLTFDTMALNSYGGYHDCNFSTLKVDAGNNMLRVIFHKPVEVWISISPSGEGSAEIPVPDGVFREGVEYI